MINEFLSSRSPAATDRLGAALGRRLRPGDLVLLTGPYGAGKTCFVRGAARGAGVRDPGKVVSPTFVLLNVYPGRVTLFHLDCHRLPPREVRDLGLADALDAGAVLIEWGDRVPSGLSPDVLRIDFEITGRTRRMLRFAGTGERGEALARSVGNKGRSRIVTPRRSRQG
jgi:tRNA threonylcarbamoyladenosine biosynthesis protein TsaE